MYPQKAACRIPLLESVALGKPRHRSIVVISTSDDVIFRWSGGESQLVDFSCKRSPTRPVQRQRPSVVGGREGDARFILFISLTTSCIVTTILHNHGCTGYNLRA